MAPVSPTQVLTVRDVGEYDDMTSRLLKENPMVRGFTTSVALSTVKRRSRFLRVVANAAPGPGYVAGAFAAKAPASSRCRTVVR